MKPTYLIFVEAGLVDHNKFYNMFPNTDGNTFRVEYGRVGAKTTTQQYPICDWDKKLTEKLKKGYTDVSDLKQELVEEVTKSGETKYKPISVESIRLIVEKLQSKARDAIQRNYTVKASAVTQSMIDKAQEKLNELAKIIHSVPDFNKVLNELFMIIPRKMDRVANFLATNSNDFEKILKREQDLLDVMLGQVYKPTQTVPDTTTVNNEITVLEENNLIMEEVSASEICMIKKLMDDYGSHSSHHFKRAWRVTNTTTQAKFDAYVKANNIRDTKLLWHGSRTENFWSIMKTGLILRPNAQVTGKMFGSGLYFAPKCQKSIGYTSLGGSYWASGNDKVAYMALFDTAYGMPYHTDTNREFFSNYGEREFQRLHPNNNCVHAHAGNQLRNDEIIFYNESQTTVKYLIEIE